MKLQRFAEQDAQARARIVAAARALPNADPELVAAVENASHRDPNVRVLREHEAVAALLESLSTSGANVAPEGLTERLEAISGVGPKLAAEIAAALKDK